jgi:hypothetical protein
MKYPGWPNIEGVLHSANLTGKSPVLQRKVTIEERGPVMKELYNGSLG